MQKKRKFDKTAFVFIAPAFIFFTLFIIVPTVSSVYYSFTSGWRKPECKIHRTGEL